MEQPSFPSPTIDHQEGELHAFSCTFFGRSPTKRLGEIQQIFGGKLDKEMEDIQQILKGKPDKYFTGMIGNEERDQERELVNDLKCEQLLPSFALQCEHLPSIVSKSANVPEQTAPHLASSIDTL